MPGWKFASPVRGCGVLHPVPCVGLYGAQTAQLLCVSRAKCGCGFGFGIYTFFRRHDHYGDKVHSVKIHLWVFDFAAASTRHGWRLVMGGVRKSLITNDSLNMIQCFALEGTSQTKMSVEFFKPVCQWFNWLTLAVRMFSV